MRSHLQTRSSSRQGFSLVELMAVISIVLVMLGMGVSGFRSLIQNQRMTTGVNDFFAAINLTRSEALRLGTRVDLVPIDGRDWANGWVVFLDKNQNQIADPDEQIIFSHGQVSGGMVIKTSFTDSSREYLAYNGAGRTRTNASSQTPQLGTISFFLDSRIRRIKLNFLGRARACNPESDKTCTGTTDAE